MADEKTSLPPLAEGEERRRYLLTSQEMLVALAKYELELHQPIEFHGTGTATVKSNGDVELVLQGKFVDAPGLVG